MFKEEMPVEGRLSGCLCLNTSTYTSRMQRSICHNTRSLSRVAQPQLSREGPSRN
jgi:hypothetical protein